MPDYNNLDELKDHYKRGGLGDVKVKKFLIKVLEEELEPIRERRAYYEKNLDLVLEILEKGTDNAKKVGRAKVYEVKKAMGIDYFADNRFLDEIKEKYK